MIRATIYQKEGVYIGIDCVGHAGYAEAGEDVVCAGVSALVLNAINSIERFTKDRFACDVEEESGLISFRFQTTPSQDGELLIKSLILGLEGIRESYGKSYISLNFQEVRE